MYALQTLILSILISEPARPGRCWPVSALMSSFRRNSTCTLAPAVAGMIRKPSALTLLDVGGDDVGATVLSALSHVLKDMEVRVIQIINPFRPFTDTPEGCRKIRREIEAASRLKVNGLIGNAHLMDETTPEEIYSGYEFARRVAEESGLPLEAITAASSLIPGLDMSRFDCPVMPLCRQMGL